MSVESRAIARAIQSDQPEEVERLCRMHRPALQQSGELLLLFGHAAKVNKPESLQILADYGCDVNTGIESRSSQTVLYSASACESVDSVRWLLDHGAKVNLPVEGEDRCLPLFVAARLGNVEIARLLIQHGANCSSKWNGQDLIECAKSHGHERFVKEISALVSGTDRMNEKAPPEQHES